MADAEQIISRGERSAHSLRERQIADHARLDGRAEREAARLQRFDALEGRNRAVGERAEQLLSRYKSLTEHSLRGYAFVLLKDPAGGDSKMWPMGVLTDRHSPGASYDLGTFATDSPRIVESAQAGKLYGGGPWQHGLEEERTYKISDSEEPIDDDLYTHFMTHIPTIGSRFAAETRAFAPVRTIQRVYWAGTIDRRLTRLEGTMDLFEGAAADVQLNPGLAQSLEAQAA